MTEKTTTGRLIAAIGGIVLIVSLFLTWYKFESSASVGGFSSSASTGVSAWDAFGLIDLILLVVGLLAIVPAALDIFDLEIELPVDMAFLALGAGGAGTALIVYRVLDKPGPDVEVNVPGFEASVGLGFGLIIGLVACVAVAVGGFRQMSEGEAGGETYAAAPPQAPPMPPPGAPPQAPPPPPQAPPQAPPAPPQAPPAPPQGPPQPPPPAG
ncbi:MAG: hypothetical protein HZB14_05255 [Actinobacteria bacterium]|nr:hypothetical protein [Actinomycetota bacterium]